MSITAQGYLVFPSQQSAEHLWQSIHALRQDGSLDDATIYELPLGAGRYYVSGKELEQAWETLNRYDAVDGKSDGRLEKFSRAQPRGLFAAQWAANGLALEYEAFTPYNPEQYAATYQIIATHLASGNIYWDGTQHATPVSGYTDFDCQSLTDLALDSNLSGAVLTAFAGEIRPWPIRLLISADNIGVGIFTAMSAQQATPHFVGLSLSANHLIGVEHETEAVAVQGIRGWVQHEKGHVLMNRLGSKSPRLPGAFTMDAFSMLMAINTGKLPLLSDLTNRIGDPSMKHQLHYFTQEVCDPAIAGLHSPLHFGRMYHVLTASLTAKLQWSDATWDTTIRTSQQQPDYGWMMAAWELQLAKSLGVDPKLVERVQRRYYDSAQAVDKTALLTNLAAWFEAVANLMEKPEVQRKIMAQYPDLLVPFQPVQ